MPGKGLEIKFSERVDDEFETEIEDFDANMRRAKTRFDEESMGLMGQCCKEYYQ